MQWIQNLCRICGQISESCHSIYNDDHNVLQEKIKKCLGINLCKGDYKPKQICNTCVVKLNELSEFIDICHATNQKFESIHLTSQVWQNRSFDYPSQKQTVIVSNKQAPDNMVLELYKNTGIVLDNLNINNCHIDDSDVLELVASENYNNENCDGDTNMKNSSLTILKHPPNTELCGEPCYVCPETNENTSNKICCINSSFKPTLSTAIKDVEKAADNEQKKTITVEAVRSGLFKPTNDAFQKEKPKKTYQCPHCSKTFLRRGTLNSHMANHTNIRPYQCGDCSKSFAVKSELTTHKKAHGDCHMCSFCSKKFSVPSKLKRHIRIHTNDKPFVCDFSNCNRAFSDKRNLDSHRVRHDPKKNYSCPMCSKPFKTLNNLKQHSRSHMCGMTYTCDLCSKAYKYKSNLISHIKKHSNVCPYCKVNCESKTILCNHMKQCKSRL